MNLQKNSFGFIVVLLMFISLRGYSQQDPMYTQYNFNTQSINPAYAGSWETLGFLVLGRHQWGGWEGAPETYNFSVQSLLKNEKVGLGLNIISDKIGKENRLSLFGDYSYGFKVSRKSQLRMGLKFGVTNYRNILSDYVQYPGEYDPELDGEIDVRYMPNFGVGALLYSDRYYIGFSIPKIIQNDFENNYGNFTVESEMRHFFLNAGYVFDLSEHVRFKPTFLTKAAIGAPVEFDFTANFLLGDKVWLGAMYRTGASYGFIAQWIFNQKLRIGYAVDFSLTEMRGHQNGSHEVMVSYEIGFRKKWTTPRMF
ncbi:MAG: type IX secretion system membrane protein PorP/SprF [Draconibacterium sp.]